MSKFKLMDCVELSGASCKKYEGVKNYVSTGAVLEDSINQDAVETYNYAEKPSRANLCVEPNTALFAKMKATKKTLWIDSDLSQCIFSTGFFAVKAKHTYLTDRCLYFLLMSTPFLRQKDQHCTGATQKAITQQGLTKIEISLPPVTMQDELVSRLGVISDAMDIKKQQLQLLDELIDSKFLDLFGDPITNEKHWPVFPLGEKCTIITGNTPSRKIPEYYGDFIEWIKSDNINTPDSFLTCAEEYLSEKGLEVGRSVDAGAILMTCIAGSVKCIGNIAIADRSVSFNQQINAIVPKENDTWFFYTMLKLSKEYIQAPVNKALKGIISKGQLSSMPFMFPPIEAQREFGIIAREIYSMRKTVELEISDLQELLDSKMEELFG